MTRCAPRSWALVLAILCCSIVVPRAGGAESPGVVVDDLSFAGGSTAVSYHLTGAFDEETVERIHSGLEVSFRHRVELLSPRKWVLFRVLGRKVLATSSVETRVSYDAVTERYALFREFGARSGGELVTSDTNSFDEARAWMTDPEPIELRHPSTTLSRDTVLVNIEVVVGRRYLAWIIPAPRTVRERRPLSP